MVIPISLTRLSVKFELVTICVTLSNVEITRNFFEEFFTISSFPWARHIEGIDKDKKLQKILIYPKKSKAMNLAFDVTPAKYVTGLITEKGVCEASEKGLKGLFK